MLIAHSGDVQVRNHSRHKEYIQSFEYLYESLKQKKPDRFALCGDIVHNKTNVSPELIDITADFLKNIADICILDIILGNHDLSLKNLSRMDAISPIVKALNHPRINFMKHSGLYPINDKCNYIVMSCVDPEEKWLKFQDLSEKDKKKVNIVLFHGTIDGAILESGFKMSSPYTLDLFKGFDYVMLGDIHKTSILDDRGRVAYPGSYPKQSYGEDLEGGYLLWDIKSKEEHELDFIKLPTVCPFYTLELGSQLIIPETLNYQKRARIRILCRELNLYEKKALKDELIQRFDPIEIKIIDDINVNAQSVTISVGDIKIENLRDEKVQETLIRNFFIDEKVTEDQLAKVVELNKTLNSTALKEEDVIRNVRFKINNIKFDNLFSYGENNELDFSKLRGIVGILGRNGVGKSSLVVDVPLYTMFNKISKDVVKNNLYVNEYKKGCSAEMEIETENKTYKIIRTTEIQQAGKRKGEAQDKGVTDLDFYAVVDGERESLKGLERSDTDKNIRKIFGTFDDFILTTVASQFEVLGFVKNKATDRKKIIGRYFDLDIFQEKHDLANEELKKLKKEVKSYEDELRVDLVVENQQKIALLESEIESNNDLLRNVLVVKDDINKEIWSLSSDKNTSANTKLIKEAESLKTEYKLCQDRISSAKKDLKELEKYSCLHNPDCCMKEKEISLFKKINTFSAQELEIKQRISEFMEKKKEHKKDESADLKKQKNAEYQRLQQEEESTRSQIARINRQIGLLNAQTLEYQSKLEKYLNLKEKYEIYNLFSKAMNKDGISYKIISDNLSLINREIKKILSSDVGFEITLEDEDKEINVYFKAEKGKKRCIELCSGMEKTIAAIAIRAALISVTSLPTSNIFVLDESLTSLDAEYVDIAGKILNNLTRIFDTVFVISHNDYVKDLCTNVICVERDESGFSKIIN